MRSRNASLRTRWTMPEPPTRCAAAQPRRRRLAREVGEPLAELLAAVRTARSRRVAGELDREVGVRIGRRLRGQLLVGRPAAVGDLQVLNPRDECSVRLRVRHAKAHNAADAALERALRHEVRAREGQRGPVQAAAAVCGARAQRVGLDDPVAAVRDGQDARVLAALRTHELAQDLDELLALPRRPGLGLEDGLRAPGEVLRVDRPRRGARDAEQHVELAVADRGALDGELGRQRRGKHGRCGAVRRWWWRGRRDGWWRRWRRHGRWLRRRRRHAAVGDRELQVGHMSLALL